MGGRRLLQTHRLRGIRARSQPYCCKRFLSRRGAVSKDRQVTLLPACHPKWADEILKVCLGAGLGAGISSCLYFLVCLLIGPSTPAYVSSEVVLLGAAGAGFWLTQ